jgi:hypothetical protein
MRRAAYLFTSMLSSRSLLLPHAQGFVPVHKHVLQLFLTVGACAELSTCSSTCSPAVPNQCWRMHRTCVPVHKHALQLFLTFGACTELCNCSLACLLSPAVPYCWRMRRAVYLFTSMLSSCSLLLAHAQNCVPVHQHAFQLFLTVGACAEPVYLFTSMLSSCSLLLAHAQSCVPVH